ncbi:MAG: phosphoribosyltransferase [Anaerolineales bacterium]|nr:phosphoribosyltransferase [Anaerolineales bacterium]
MEERSRSYDYAARQGVLEISWQDFGQLAARLTELLAPTRPEAIIGIARAGLFPATAVACMLRCELYPARLTRRLNDQIIYPAPVWKTPVSPEVADKVVAVIDEIADSGETLAMVADQVRLLGAKQVVTACLVNHSWAKPAPDFTALISDALLIFPWDHFVFQDGKWLVHPEISEALLLQGRDSTNTAELAEN